MFNLENAIKTWKRRLRSNPAFEDGDIAELESHLLEEIERLRVRGMSEKEAFQKATGEIGPVHQLKQEWDKTRFRSTSKQQKFMFKQSFTALPPSYITTAFRNLRKRFGYSVINIIGLTTGLATCILILFFVTHELSYDRFHEDAGRIHRIVTSTSDDGIPTNANGIFGTGPLLKKNYPDEVEEYGRIRRTVHNSKMYVAHERNKFYEDGFYFADPGFLKLFNFPVIKGDISTALSTPNTIVLTESAAGRYFGDEDPLGKTMTADPYQDGDLMEFEVTGVLEDIPRNTHFEFDFLASYQSQREEGLMTRMGGFQGNYTYLKLSETTDPKQFESKFDAFLVQNWQEDPWYSISLQPLIDIHLHSHIKSELKANGNITYVYIFGAVAVLILAIACINFINLTTARSTERAREVGLRKAMGAHKTQLIGQFLGEALVMTVLSGLTALLLVDFFLPMFNSLTQKDFHLAEFLSASNILGYLGFLFGVGTSHNTFDISGLEQGLSMAYFFVDKDFIKTYDLKLLAGNEISTPVTEPGKADFLASELAIREAGLESPEDLVGRTVNWDEYSGSITGVVNDMILYDLRKDPYSIMFFITPIQHHKFASVRINTAQTQEALGHIEEVWNNQVASYPLEYSFLDDKFEEMHLSDQNMAQTVTYFAILAILIACLGLFGLAAYMAERKRKEIGVRKVLGATVPNIIRLLSMDFMKLVVLSLLIGIPIAYYGISRWLQGFVYKVEIGPGAFLTAVLLLLAITFTTIGYQAVKSARMNPVKSLGRE